MERHGDEVELTTREARAGTGPRAMRTVLLVSLALVIVILSLLWITKASVQPEPNAPTHAATAAP